MPHQIRAFLLAFLLVSLSWASTALAQTITFPKDLSKWIVTVPPKPATKRWFAANYSRSEWKVSLHKGKPAVRLYDPAEPRQKLASLPFSPREKTAGAALFTRVSDGWIVGFNGGEWGGSLWWYARRGERHYCISKDQVSGFFHTRVGLLALEGLAHMSLSRGQIIQLHKDANGRWRSSRFVDLKHAPETATQATDGSLVVATTDRLLRIHLDKKTEVLLPHTFWGGLYPNSLVVTPTQEIYLGMRHGVARIQLRNRKVEVVWLLPNRAFVNAKAEL